MTEYFTQSQVIAAVPGLSQARLAVFFEADLVTHLWSSDGPLFRPVDLARLELLSELSEHFDLDADALAAMMGLIDQLHTARHRLHAMAQAMAAEPLELRSRVGARFVGILGD